MTIGYNQGNPIPDCPHPALDLEILILTFAQSKRQQWLIVLSAILTALGVGGAGLVWWRRDLWPVRVVIPHPTLAHMRTPGFTRDSRSFVVGIRKVELVAWDVATGRPRQPRPDPIILEPVMAHDGRSFAGLVGLDPQNPDVVWADVASGEVRGRLPIRAGRVQHLAWSGDDQSIEAFILGEDSQVTVVTWNRESGVATRRPIHDWPHYLGFRAISPDGRLRVYSDQGSQAISFWDRDEDRPRGGLPRELTQQTDRAVNPVFSPDGRNLFVCRTDGQIECWDVEEARLIRTLAAPLGNQGPSELSLSPDGRILAVSGADRRPTRGIGRAWEQVQRWIGWKHSIRVELALIDSASGAILVRIPQAYAAIFAPDSRSVATLDGNETISIRDIPAQISPPAQ